MIARTVPAITFFLWNRANSPLGLGYGWIMLWTANIMNNESYAWSHHHVKPSRNSQLKRFSLNIGGLELYLMPVTRSIRGCYSLKIEWIFTLFVTDVTPWVVTSVITSFGVNIEYTWRDSTRWVVNQVKFTPQRMKFLHSIDGVNYSLDFFFRVLAGCTGQPSSTRHVDPVGP